MEVVKKSRERYRPKTVYGIVCEIRRYFEEKKRAEDFILLTKGKIFNISKIKMTMWLEQIRFIILMHVLFFLKFILFRRSLDAELKANAREGLHLKSRNEEKEAVSDGMYC